jgi:hypothetical protein
MTKTTKRAPKKAKAKTTGADTVLTPLGDGRVCYCGCKRVADSQDWDTGQPLSVACLIERARSAGEDQSA